MIQVRRSAWCTFTIAALALTVQEARSDNPFERALKTFGSDAAVKGYVQPLQDLVGANMSSGWYRSAYVPSSGLNISFNVVGMAALLNDDLKNYDAPTPPGFTQKTFRTATVFGKKGALVNDSSRLSYRGTDGAINASFFPLATLQATIGHIQGTEVIVRGIPLPEVSGFPKVTFWGVGARHSINQYLWDDDKAPIFIALGVFYNKISIGDIVEAKSLVLGPQVGTQLSILELYGGVAYTNSTMKLHFTSSQAGSPVIDVELEAKDKVRGTLGAALNLGFLHLNLDANIGSVTNLSAMLGFGF